MKRKELHRNVRLLNTVAQHPLVFPRGVISTQYDVTPEGEVEHIADALPLNRGYFGKITHTPSGVYCAGFTLSEIFEELPFDEAREMKGKPLPSKFDYKVLMKLIEASKGKRKVSFPSQYAFLQELGVTPNAQNYRRLVMALNKWLFLTLHYVGRFRWRGKNKKGAIRARALNILYGYDIPDYIDEPCPLSVIISQEFLEVITGSHTAPLDTRVALKLPSEAAINIYQYLSSFDLVLRTGKGLKRGLKEFGTAMLSTSEKPSRLKVQITKAIADINEAIEEETEYHAKFTTSPVDARQLVVFTKHSS